MNFTSVAELLECSFYMSHVENSGNGFQFLYSAAHPRKSSTCRARERVNSISPTDGECGYSIILASKTGCVNVKRRRSLDLPTERWRNMWTIGKINNVETCPNFNDTEAGNQLSNPNLLWAEKTNKNENKGNADVDNPERSRK